MSVLEVSRAEPVLLWAHTQHGLQVRSSEVAADTTEMASVAWRASLLCDSFLVLST
jgi:hypothetical protein